MVVRPPSEIPTVILKTDPKRKPVEFKMPLDLDINEDLAKLLPGEYITNHRCNDPAEWDIQRARVHLLSAGINPEINICSLNNGYYFNRIQFTTRDGTVTLRSKQANWAEAQEFARVFSEQHSQLDYRLQTQGVLTHEALMLLLKPKRLNISSIRESIAKSQNMLCAQCSCELFDYEIDHTQSLATSETTTDLI